MKKAIALLIVLGTLGGLGWQVYRKVTAEKRGPSGKRPGGAVAVELAPVRRATIHQVERLTGTLRPRWQFTVAPKIAGRLEKLHVNVADPVAPGQLLAELDAAEYREQVEQAKAELAVAKSNADQILLTAQLEDDELAQKAAQAEAELGIAKATVEEMRSTLEVASREFERAKALRGKTIMSQSELDAAEGNYKTAKAKSEVAQATVAQKEAALRSAQVRLSDTQKSARAAEHKLALATVAQKEAALKAAEVRLSYAQITATSWNDPKELRVVGERYVDEGAMLKANDPIVSVLDISVMKALVHVIERDYSKVAPGQQVGVTTDAVAGRTFQGKIMRVAPLLKESSRQAVVEIEIPNPEGLLKPGMFVKAEIELQKHADAVAVPYAALVKRGGMRGTRGVFVADRKALKAHFVPVTVGIVEGELAEAVRPPSELDGASVVVLGQHLLEDGGAITIPDDKPVAAPKPPARGPAGEGGH